MSGTSSICKKDSLTDRKSPTKQSAGKRLLASNRLKIVKSFEGSETLNKWKKLATPHLGVVLESNSGVQSKAHKDLNQELLQYVLDANIARRKSSSSSEGAATVVKEVVIRQQEERSSPGRSSDAAAAKQKRCR